jgi:hypothetical protein
MKSNWTHAHEHNFNLLKIPKLQLINQVLLWRISDGGRCGLVWTDCVPVQVQSSNYNVRVRTVLKDNGFKVKRESSLLRR